MELQVRNSNTYLDLEYLMKDETFSVKKLELLKNFTLKCLLNSISLILGLSSIFRGASKCSSVIWPIVFAALPKLNRS